MASTLRKFGLLAAAALLVAAVAIKPAPVAAMGSDTPYPTTDDSKKKKEKKDGNAIELQEQKLVQEKFLVDDYAQQLDALEARLTQGPPFADVTRVERCATQSSRLAGFEMS